MSVLQILQFTDLENISSSNFDLGRIEVSIFQSIATGLRSSSATARMSGGIGLA